MKTLLLKKDLLVIVLLSLLLITTSAALPNVSTNITSFGRLIYWDFSFEVGFEHPEDFRRGIEHYKCADGGNYTYWDRGGYIESVYPEGVYLFEPDTTIVHSESQSALLALLDPTEDLKRRNKVFHDWSPNATEYIWQEMYFYFPDDFRFVNSEGKALWCTIFGMSERMWNPDRAVPGEQEHALKIGVIWHRYLDPPRPVFSFCQGPRRFDNDNDGVWDTGGDKIEKFFWFTQGPSVPTETWIHIKSHIYRNLSDWDNGYVEYWITNESTGETIHYKEDPCRTIGIDPDLMASLTPNTQGKLGGEKGYGAWLSSGFSIYEGLLEPDTEVPPAKIYVDDFFAAVHYVT